MTELEYHVAQVQLAALSPAPPADRPAYSIVDVIAVAEGTAKEDVRKRVQEWCENVPGCQKMLDAIRSEVEASKELPTRATVVPASAGLTLIARRLVENFDLYWVRLRTGLNEWVRPLLASYSLPTSHAEAFMSYVEADLRTHPFTDAQRFGERLPIWIEEYAVQVGLSCPTVQIDEERVAINRWAEGAPIAEEPSALKWSKEVRSGIQAGKITRLWQFFDDVRVPEVITDELRKTMEDERVRVKTLCFQFQHLIYSTAA